MSITTLVAERTELSRHPAVGILTLAFAGDPVIRWIWPDAGRFLQYYPDAAAMLGEGAFAAGTADIAPGGAGAALWVPPGASDDSDAAADAAADLIVRSVDASRHDEMFGFLEQTQAHHPTRPHWYLPFIGVDPHQQGRGVGSGLMRSALARVDTDGLGAYLEATSERNRALYERHGFVVQAEIRSATSPPLWPMWREPSIT
ncbi:GNAT family N-acetyltransferase [Agromyces sp. NPDC049794]|uniref:GNAT family N-acetyltransferase n=1 Tax=unclassified Agromyces TaxID=2639701 RepID=UPI0033CC3DF9